MGWPLLSTRVFYALKILSCLASAKGPARAGEVARCAKIPPAQAAKTLYLLTWKGYVASRRGPRGGFWLRIPSHRIRVEDVIRFFHPPDDRQRGDSRDPILRLWRSALTPCRRSFDKLTLADLLKKGVAARCLRNAATETGDFWLEAGEIGQGVSL